MIPLPNLPTDNLYKFLFVFGITLTLASQFFLYKTLDSRATDILDLNRATVIYLQSADSSTIVWNKIDRTIKDSSYGHPSHRLNNFLNAQLDSLRLSNNSARRKFDDFKTKSQLVNAQFAFAEFEAISLLILGLLMAFSGAILWYKRAQIPNDLLIQLQVEQLQIELDLRCKPQIIGRRHREPVIFVRR